IEIRRKLSSPPDVALVEGAGARRVPRAADNAAAVGEDREADLFEIGRQKLRGTPDAPQTRESPLERGAVRPLPGSRRHLNRVAAAELDRLGGPLPLERGESPARADGTRRRRARALEEPLRREASIPDLERKHAAGTRPAGRQLQEI